MSTILPKSTARVWLRHASRAALVSLAALSVVACDDVIKDPTFHQWCGDTLCAWTLEAGHIRKAPTWTDKDYGVEFVDTPTRISQSVSDSPKCLKFSTIGLLDPSAQLTVSIDFDRDGTVDFTQPVPSAEWTQVETVVTAPKVYGGFTLYIEKKGTGRSLLAQMRVQSSSDCAAPGVKLGTLPIGDRCSPTDPTAATCETGICCAGVCSECCSDHDCRSTLSADAGSSSDADTADGGEAGSSDAGNPAAATCAVSTASAAPFSLPAQCDPGAHDHKSGAPCLTGDDCASGACDGALIHGSLVGSDGGTCGALSMGCYVQYASGGHCR
jgi:hypothetical protein